VITDPLFYLLAAPAMILVGISKSGFGGGLSVLAVSLLALVVEPRQAAAILLPVLCLMDLFGAWAYRRTWDRRAMLLLLPAAAIGIGIGTIGFRVLDATMIRLLVGLVALAFSLDYWLARAWQRAPKTLGPMGGVACGALAGFTSFVAHAGLPPLALYLLPRRLDKSLFVGTTVMFFFAVNYAKLVPYAWLGQLSTTNLATAAVLAPLAPVGIRLGLWLHARIPETPFYHACYGLLALTGARLVYEPLSALL